MTINETTSHSPVAGGGGQIYGKLASNEAVVSMVVENPNFLAKQRTMYETVRAYAAYNAVTLELEVEMMLAALVIAHESAGISASLLQECLLVASTKDLVVADGALMAARH